MILTISTFIIGILRNDNLLISLSYGSASVTINGESMNTNFISLLIIISSVIRRAINGIFMGIGVIMVR